MVVLGLNHGEYNSSAAIVDAGVVVAGAAEERFTRHKRTKAFPTHSVRYCLEVVPVREEYRTDLAAVTHVDGSGRLQTLRREDNRRLYDVILAFEDRAGYPVILNTSFNVNGEPIVCTPDDALTTFFNSGLRVLVLGDLLVRK